MTNTKRLFIVLLLQITILYSGFCQQPQVYNQFFMNPYMYNPAYVGVEGHAALFAFYRKQWANIQNGEGPEVQHVSFHVPLKGGIAFGAAAFNRTEGPLKVSAGKITGGYLVNIDRTHFIRFGMSIGAGFNSTNVSRFDALDDPAFKDLIPTSTFLIGDFGATYHFGHFNIGISLPNIFSHKAVAKSSFEKPSLRPADNMLFKINYRGHINHNIAIEPHFIYRLRNSIPNQYEGTVIAHLKHIIWVGATYRQDKTIALLAGAKLFEKIGIGGSYELNQSLLGPTFEVKIGYHIGTKKDHARHTSSFIKSHKLSAEERAALAEKKRLKKLEKLAAKEKTDESEEEDKLTIAQETSPKEEELKENTNQEKSVENTEKTNTLPPTEKENPNIEAEAQEQSTEEQTVTNDTSNAQETPTNPTYQQQEVEDKSNENELPSKQELTKPTNTRPIENNTKKVETVKRGNHLLELPSGNYVIAGSFDVFEHAENYSDQLFDRGFHDAKVGYSSSKGHYYVVVYESPSLSRARARRDVLRTKSSLSKAWVLQVID